ncbi:major facilitator superfamily MFS_1 [Actinobacteria bacterium OK074]|nr:major facilitator superfamily MFS_1 [Actinobacteria bacterium OK074]
MIKEWWRSNVPTDASARRFVTASLVDSFGSGVRSTIFPLFLVLVAGLPVGQVGLGLVVAGLVGLVVSPSAGRLCDRTDPRRVLLTGYGGQALVSCGLVLIHTFWVFCVLMSIGKVASQTSRIGRNSLIASLGSDRRNIVKAQTNVFVNLGMTLAMGLSAVVLAVGTRSAYVAGFVLDAVTFCVAALLQQGVRLPARPVAASAAPAPVTKPWRTALGDHRYATVAALNGLLYFHQSVLFLGIPLWIASQNRLPHVVTTAVFVLNMLLTTLFQVRFSASVSGARAAGRAWRSAAAGVTVACLLVSAADRPGSGVVNTVFVVAAAVFFTLGELWFSASEMEISTDLAPPDQRGLYQGVFTLGRDVVETLAPLFTALLCVSLGRSGWLLLAAGFAVFALVAPAAVGWAARETAPRAHAAADGT